MLAWKQTQNDDDGDNDDDDDCCSCLEPTPKDSFDTPWSVYRKKLVASSCL